MKKETETFYPENRDEWRKWLAENHSSKQSVWLIHHKKKTGVPSVAWSDAVDEALCFGWIDSTRRSLENDMFMQFFSKRKAKSVWSKINKDKIERLTEEGLMTQAGLAVIEAAKADGSWTTLDEAEKLVIPADLTAAFQTRPGSEDFFLSLSKSSRKAILQWLLLAKQQETRQRRINEIAELAGQGLKPKQF
ncbi:hypothetical protein GVN16_25520 [Emticicia sp. CRIBPO]|uniref:YdeI/OmpD-associated family protein n=1 Tax=Emticicia sp. CRIBPO TaxID=2683258 RepID=UPI0014134F95|nr:YdeI/OmpD-associated family protein [Emticicia sp. CRIBPO]NBA89163.1 hypothetical protein [Emticicia sp. CRIBPO]